MLNVAVLVECSDAASTYAYFLLSVADT